ncbi:3-isopropylmalate dehydratase large subunit [Candidatus Uzinura diaspidicola str. ASNER]|uniref:3-isopropylmalate dehydratase n=1 Tax=Candidatus Uzinura diaspidicola str. ASNER TaxID=1133592 RepID=L7VJJ0_9FLAO|nr:3-isopropylmalate dehydratase large subunit [Candidatus Uzinura diaspidicola str. ASNER]
MSKTLFDKVWYSHIVESFPKGPSVLYIDRHFIHEVTSPQAFEELKTRVLLIFKKERIIATVDHNVPTKNQHLPILDALSRKQVQILFENCKINGIDFFGLLHNYQGIVHIIGPELGYTLPGMTIVCGDSHTSTHGAFGSISFGIGTSQVSMVMASQCLLQKKPKQMRIHLVGLTKISVTPKDIILYIISKVGTDGAVGYFVEFSGKVFRRMSMEGRMTVCNMSIEIGAKGGLIAPDKTTLNYLNKIKFLPKDILLEEAMPYWRTLYTESDIFLDREYYFYASDITPMITYGTNPGMGFSIVRRIPKINVDYHQSISYMGFKAGYSLIGKPIQYVFIGSCTNARIEDLRIVANVVKNKKKAFHVLALIVPGSKQVIYQAKKEGLDIILKKSGFEFREPGCSACLGMNEDKLPFGAYCISTSNRNFVGRQGFGARTLLTSPLVAAIVAIEGKIIDVNNFYGKN